MIIHLIADKAVIVLWNITALQISIGACKINCVKLYFQTQKQRSNSK